MTKDKKAPNLRAPKNLKRRLSNESDDSFRNIFVLLILLIVVVVLGVFFMTLSNEPSIKEVNHAEGFGEADALEQVHAFRPIDGVIVNRPGHFASKDEVLGDRKIDPRNFPAKVDDDEEFTTKMDLQDYLPLRAKSLNVPEADLNEEEKKRLAEARKILEDAMKPLPAWPQDGDGIEPPDEKPAKVETPLERLTRKALASGNEATNDPVVIKPLEAIGKFPHGPAIKVARVTQDTYNLPSVDLNLLREVYRGEYKPLEGGDAEKGPFMRPIQMESPWLAMDALIRDVAKEGATLKAKTNGEVAFEGKHPEIVLNLRGRVFTLRGRLFMLRKQPLRGTASFDRNGQKVTEAYFGIVAYVKKSIVDGSLEHHSTAFTVLDLPEELKQYALEADEFASNDDLLANTPINVELQGVYFRRFCFTEPIAKVSVDQRGQPDKEEDDKIKVAEFATEAYMPWLIAPEIATTEIAPLSLAEIKEAVDAVHSEAKVTESQRQRFDEAGYYLCLQALNDPSNALADIEATELVMRMLTEPAMARAYRGGHAKAAGILRDTYHLLVLPPNISGKRHVYRAFVTDALDAREADTLQQWYVDLLEPPVRFQGEPRVMIDGIYYRSQRFAAEYQGKIVDARVPLLIAKKLELYDPSAFKSLHQRKDEDDGNTTVWIALAAFIFVVIVVLFLVRLDRKGRIRFENEAMDHVRGRLAKARERIRDDRKGREAKKSEEDANKDAANDPKDEGDQA